LGSQFLREDETVDRKLVNRGQVGDAQKEQWRAEFGALSMREGV